MDIEGVLAISFFFGTVFGIFYIYFFTRHRERMNLIDKGLTAEAFRRSEDPARTLKYGMLLMGVALGLVTGYLLETYAGMPEPLPYFIMVALFGGLALVIYYMQFGRRQQG
ncbi:MAG: polysulfide reductase NrfD [Flavobacteriales bacterium]|nr:polysulfide reductase NrfD [Flavobacteriales bacterium]